jgi:hypothetical protein
MRKLNYDVKDLFCSLRLGFSIQRIWINGIGLLVSYVIYLLFTYFSLLISGYNFGTVWQKFGLLPCAFAVAVPWFVWFIYGFGLVLSIFCILLTNTAVARTSYMALRREMFYSWTQAFRFAKKKWMSISGALLTFVLMILIFVIASLVMGLIGRIPFIGEIGTAILSLIYLFAALVLLFIFATFFVGILLIPAILAAADEDALGSVFQSFSLTYNHPWRLGLYGVVVGILEIVGMLIFSITLKLSYTLFIKLFTLGMGDKILSLKSRALQIVDKSMPVVYGWMQKLPAGIGDFLYLQQGFTSPTALPEVQIISPFIFALFILFSAGIVLAYGEAVGNSGLTIMYIVLFQKKEGENLLEREDAELKEIEDENQIQVDEENNSKDEKVNFKSEENTLSED